MQQYADSDIEEKRKNAKKENCVFYTALISVLQKKIKKGRTKLIRRFGFFHLSFRPRYRIGMRLQGEILIRM
jgi:hypothetical protein